MIEVHLRKSYQRILIEPLLRSVWVQKVHPSVITIFSLITGLLILPSLMMGYSFIAVLCLALSGFLDTLDGSIARHTQRASPKGAALDIISDRVVEFVIILSLFLIDPASRALPSLFMLGSVLICITSFLIVGIFTQNESQKSFHYSPGLMERAEAFIFFAAMILFPLAFPVLSALFSLLVAITALIHIFQFFHQSDII